MTFKLPKLVSVIDLYSQLSCLTIIMGHKNIYMTIT